MADSLTGEGLVLRTGAAAAEDARSLETGGVDETALRGAALTDINGEGLLLLLLPPPASFDWWWW